MFIRKAITVALCSLSAVMVSADITTDGSLTGLTRSVPGSTAVSYLVTEDFGLRVDTNLFFSFADFQINLGEVAEFQTGALPTDNLIGRITNPIGASLLGTLRSNTPGTNLWLISPAGWVFGEAAAIDAMGAVYISTADSLGFANGDEFSSTTPLLNLPSDQPLSFSYGAVNLGTITGDGLRVSRTTTFLGLYSQTIELSDLRVGSSIAPSQTSIEIVASGPASTTFVADTDAAVTGGSVTLNNSNISLQGDGQLLAHIRGAQVSLNETRISGTGIGSNASRIFIRGGQIVIDAESELISTVPSTSLGTRGVDIDLQADGLLQYNGNFQSTARAIDSSSGDIRMTGQDIIFDGADFSLSRAAPGDSGIFEISATDSLMISNSELANDTIFGNGQIMRFTATDIIFDNLFLQADTQDTMSGPGISLTADSISLINGTNLTADVERGSGAGISVDVAGRLLVDNNSLITTESFDDAVGNPLTINAGQVELRNGGRLTSDVVLSGSGGTISLTADSLEITADDRATGIFARSGSFSFDPGLLQIFLDDPNFALGDGGNIVVTVNDLQIDGGQITTDTAGRGNAGRINIIARNNLNLEGSNHPTTISSNSTATFDQFGPATLGGGGGINIEAGQLSLIGDARISSNTDSNLAPGGTITITAQRLEFGGNPQIATTVIDLLDRGVASAAAFTGIVSNSTGAAAGGSLNLLLSELSANAGIISASASGTGGGGDVLIGTPDKPVQLIITDATSGVLARAQQGNGGNIFISSEQLVQDVNAVVSADSTAGNAGTIDIVAPELDISGAIADLDVPILDATALLRDACAIDPNAESSSLVLSGNGGARAAPDQYQPGVRSTDSGSSPPLATLNLNGNGACARASGAGGK